MATDLIELPARVGRTDQFAAGRTTACDDSVIGLQDWVWDIRIASWVSAATWPRRARQLNRRCEVGKA